MIMRLFREKKAKRKQSKPSKIKPSRLANSSKKILTAEGWRRLTARQKKVKKR